MKETFEFFSFRCRSRNRLSKVNNEPPLFLLLSVPGESNQARGIYREDRLSIAWVLFDWNRARDGARRGA